MAAISGRSTQIMDSFEFNKIAGAVLGTLLFVMGLNLFSEAIFSHSPPKVPGYDLPSAEEKPAGEAQAAVAAPAVSLPKLLAAADPKKGEGLTKACSACHVFDKGGTAKVGPPLYGVVDRPVAEVAGFAYSDALKGKGGKWTFDALNNFIDNPKSAVPGTKMTYAGEKDPAKRADILAYLRTLSDSPAPLPQ
jgi:cytochrome c